MSTEERDTRANCKFRHPKDLSPGHIDGWCHYYPPKLYEITRNGEIFLESRLPEVLRYWFAAFISVIRITAAKANHNPTVRHNEHRP